MIHVVVCTYVPVYADNAKLFSNTVNDLQSSLSRIAIWLHERQLLLAPSKCKHLCISRSFISQTHHFCIDSYNIRLVTAVKDFGVYICRILKWSHHIQHIYFTANVCAYQIMRALSTKNIRTLLKAFITYVRPKFEYNSPVWNPYLKKVVHLLESIQRKFSRDVFVRRNIPFTSYAGHLHKLGVKSLEYCRLEFDVILMFEIYYNLSDLQFVDYFIHSKRMYNLRSHEFVIQSKFYASCDQFRNFLFNRIVKIWNSLPHDLVSATTLQVFKRRLKKFDLLIYVVLFINFCSVFVLIYSLF